MFKLVGATVYSPVFIIGGRETKNETCCGPAGALKMSDLGTPGALQEYVPLLLEIVTARSMFKVLTNSERNQS